MKQRMKAEERREQLLALMTHLHQQAENQRDFTAEIVAKAAGISTVLLYRSVGAEFQKLRAQLPGVHRVRDEVISELRHEKVDLEQQLQAVKAQLRTTALTELDEAIQMIELLEEENLRLRGEVKRLRKQLDERTRVVVHVPTNRSAISPLALVGKEDIVTETSDE
jgi:uncharacterized damage-inducible protein DinB